MRVFFILSAAALLLSFIACSSSESTESADERPGRNPAEMFSAMDNNGDSRLSWDEFKAMPARMGTPEERFQRMDKDTDGFVTYDEFSTALEESRGRHGEGGRHGSGGGQRGRGF
jgi:Ca2+-binding EF-hand superfamily protein